MRFVQVLDKVTDLTAEDTLERHMIRSDDVDSNAALTQGGGDFESDKACPNDDDLFCGRCLIDDCAAVGERSKVVKLGGRSSRHIQLDWFGSGRQQECAEVISVAVIELDSLPLNINRRDPRIEDEINSLASVEIRRSQRHPFFRRRPG